MRREGLRQGGGVFAGCAEGCCTKVGDCNDHDPYCHREKCERHRFLAVDEHSGFPVCSFVLTPVPEKYAEDFPFPSSVEFGDENLMKRELSKMTPEEAAGKKCECGQYWNDPCHKPAQYVDRSEEQEPSWYPCYWCEACVWRSTAVREGWITMRGEQKQ